jgi:hypothetical protein
VHYDRLHLTEEAMSHARQPHATLTHAGRKLGHLLLLMLFGASLAGCDSGAPTGRSQQAQPSGRLAGFAILKCITTPLHRELSASVVRL